jgi:hypothetical protein
MLGVWDEFQDHWFDYFRNGPYQTWSVLGRAMLDLLVIAVLLWAFMTAVERARRPVLRKLGCLAFVAIVLIALDIVRTRGLRLYGEGFLKLLGKGGVAALAAALGCGLLYAVFRHDRAVFRKARAGLLFLSALLPINLATAAWAVYSAWPARFYAAKPPLSPAAPPRSAHRVVWIIFDEWDQYLTFENRAKGLALPEIDRFRGQALFGERVFPPAGNTLESLPSLLTGRIIQSAKRTVPNDLLLTFADSKKTEPWSTQPNVFQRARQLGVNAAIVGFYHPYPRILGGDVMQSFSLSSLTTHEDDIYWQGIGGLDKLALTIEESLHRIPLIERSGLLGERRTKRTFRILYLETRAEALKSLQNRNAGLLLLHLPIPHPPAIFDRARGRVAADAHGGYEENLALMDATLGEFRRTMQANGEWDNSFVLLTSDHPLRGRSASRRPWIPFLLKVPGQKQTVSYAPAFNSVLSQDLILAALRGELRAATDVVKWLNRTRSRFPATAAQ